MLDAKMADEEGAPCSEYGPKPREYEVYSSHYTTIPLPLNPPPGGVFSNRLSGRYGAIGESENIGTPRVFGKAVFDMALQEGASYPPATMVSEYAVHRTARPPISLTFVVLLLGLVCLSGCVRRRMTIRTNPPGAMVYVDGYPIGTTPISTNYIHYGTRELRLVKDRCETMTVQQPMPAPWYQIPPIDFVAETLVPQEIHDHRTLTYQLVPQRVVPPDELRARAEDIRARAAAPGVVPAAATLIQPPPAYGSNPPSSPPLAEPIPSPPPSGYAYPPALAPGTQPDVPPPTTLPPSLAPQLPPGLQTLPQGGLPIR